VNGEQPARTAFNSQGAAASGVLDTLRALIVILDLDGRITFFNRAAEATTGYRTEEVLGRRAWEFLVAPEDVEQERTAFENLVGGAFQTQREAIWICRDQSRRLISWSNAFLPRRSEVVDTGVDLTERWKAEQALQREMGLVELLEAIAKAATESATAEEALQVALKEVCAHTAWRVGHAWLLDAAGRPSSAVLSNVVEGAESLAKLAELDRSAVERLGTRASAAGRPVWLEEEAAASERLLRDCGVRSGIAFPVLVGHEVVAVLEFFSDEPVAREQRLVEVLRNAASQLGRAVERKRAEEELGRLFAREQAALAKAEDGNRARDLFLATLSHELRTPLTAILGWVQMLIRGELPPERARRGLQAIETNAIAQRLIVDDILDMSRIIMGKLAIERRDVDPAALVHEAVESARPAAEKKSIHLETSADPRAKPIHGDPARLKQVIGNLLSNSIKFSEPGSMVRITLAPVIAGETELTRIAVSDSGSGIAPAVLPQIFDPFRQEDSSTTRTRGGLGLGLTIVRRLVELHGGTVRAESAGKDQGATFTVDLPVGPVAARSERHELESRLPGERPFATPLRLEGLRVLVVDDVAEARQVIGLILDSFGAEVKTAGSTQEALRLLESEPHDVLVSDIAMPVEDGYALLRRVRASPISRVRSIPSVALSAYAAYEDQERALSAGFQAYVTKPVDAHDLAGVLAVVSGRLEPEPPRPTA
jgi:PAS domain S-box-containing protein